MALVATDTLEADKLFKGIGIEPLSPTFNARYLAKALEGKKTPIKSALLDQRVIAGLGNIYVCEALFLAGISPKRWTGRRSAMPWPSSASTFFISIRISSANSCNRSPRVSALFSRIRAS